MKRRILFAAMLLVVSCQQKGSQKSGTTASTVAEQLDKFLDLNKAIVGQPLSIRGTEGMVVNFAKCCRPIPGDLITGIFNPGKGIVVHRQGCPNLGEYRKHGSSWLEVQWEDAVGREFSSEIHVEVGNQRGVLATVASTIADTGCNIENVAVDERDGLSSTLKFILSVRDRKQLARIMRRLRALPKVMHITRGEMQFHRPTISKFKSR